MMAKCAWRSLLIVLFVEVGYYLVSRHISKTLGWDSMNGEIIRSFLRLLTAYLDWVLLRDVIVSRRFNKAVMFSPLLLAAMATFLIVPVVLGNYGLPPVTGYVFAATSLIVGIKEEILFRGITLNILAEYIGKGWAVLLSSLIFTIWHVGVVDAGFWNFMQIFMAGIFLGLIYVGTGSLLLAIVLHSVYDALFSLSPFVDIVERMLFGLLFLGVSLLIVTIWMNRFPTQKSQS